MNIKLVLLPIFSFFVGCSLQPTKVYESQKININGLVEGAQKPLVIDEHVFVIDARSPFDYNVAHIPQSVNIQWQEFSRSGAINRGLLSEDLFKEARRLALKGLTPKTPVIIVGNGLEGSGEEGRLAWTLLYLGFENVQFASHNYFKKIPLTSKETPPKTNVPVWKPQFIESLLVDVKEVKQIISNPQSLKEQVFIIDVRTEKEFFRRQGDLSYEFPDINAIHIPWTQFITEYGRPNFKIKNDLKDLGIFISSRVIVISHQGLRSGAVAAALTSMGYTNVSNFAGGYQQLF